MSTMHKYVIGGITPGPSKFEDEKTVTQGHFNQHLQSAQLPPAAAKDNREASPRVVAINAISARSASAAAARLPLVEDGHALDALGRSASVNPSQMARPPPFWEGSTIDGSAFSDSASNLDLNEGYPQRPPSRPSFRQDQQPPSRKHRSSHSSHRLRHDDLNGRNQFLIGDDGLIGGKPESPTIRPTMTPGGRDRRSHFSRVVEDFDRLSEGSQNMSSPERNSPSSRRSHQVRQLAIRKSPQQVASFPRPAASAPAVAAASQARGGQWHEPERHPPSSRISESKPAEIRRHARNPEPSQDEAESTDADSPQPDPTESDFDNIEQEPTPKATIKITKVANSKSQVNRQLFADGHHTTRVSKEPMTLVESAMSRQAPPMLAKKRPLESDYDDRALASMQFDKLKNEDFDFDPAKAEALSAEIPQGTLEDKLKHFVGKDKQTQNDFFTKMSVKDWEESGDWFLERFGGIVNKFKDARKSRRAIADQFESEVAGRAETVRNKIARIDETLGAMRKEGSGLMQRDFA